MASRQQWFETLRLSIRQEHGKGWSVREIGATNRNPIGRCQLTRIWEDRTRSSVVLQLEWKANNATKILSAVGQLRTLMEERNLSLQDANKLNTELLAGHQQNPEEEFAGWPEVAARFLKTQEGAAAPPSASSPPGLNVRCRHCRANQYRAMATA